MENFVYTYRFGGPCCQINCVSDFVSHSNRLLGSCYRINRLLGLFYRINRFCGPSDGTNRLHGPFDETNRLRGPLYRTNRSRDQFYRTSRFRGPEISKMTDLISNTNTPKSESS